MAVTCAGKRVKFKEKDEFTRVVVYHLLVTHSVKQHVRQVLGPRIGACEEALASREPTPREASVVGAPG